jgi:3-dehydroquinate synthase
MKLTMRLGVRSYDIIIKQGSLSRVGQLINLNRRVLVVSDTGVPEGIPENRTGQCRRACP